jgi:hypothetical protein
MTALDTPMPDVSLVLPGVRIRFMPFRVWVFGNDFIASAASFGRVFRSLFFRAHFQNSLRELEFQRALPSVMCASLSFFRVPKKISSR